MLVGDELLALVVALLVDAVERKAERVLARVPAYRAVPGILVPRHALCQVPHWFSPPCVSLTVAQATRFLTLLVLACIHAPRSLRDGFGRLAAGQQDESVAR